MKKELADWIDIGVSKYLAHQNLQMEDVRVFTSPPLFNPDSYSRTIATVPILGNTQITSGRVKSGQLDLSIREYQGITFGVLYIYFDQNPYEFYLFKHGEMSKLALRHKRRKRSSRVMPTLDENVKREFFKHTIDFMKAVRGNKWGLKPVRGIILKGDPGNGKSMLCKYLERYAIDKSINTSTISAAGISGAWQNNNLVNLMNPDNGGFLFCDDVDVSFLSRKMDGTRSCDLLSAMQGVHKTPKKPLVRIFTTNERVEDLDPAFVRPGRIDVVLTLKAPTADLRKEYIETWPEEISQHVKVDEIVDMTNKWSFAEIEEIKQRIGVAILMNDDIPTDFSDICRRPKKKSMGFS